MKKENAGFNRCSTIETWFKKRTRTEKKLMIATFVTTLLLLFFLFICLMVLDEPEVCSTSTCVKASMELLNYMDIKADPCEDFYRFSCGNFLQNTNLADHRSRSAHTLLEDQTQIQIKNLLEQPVRSPGLDSAKKFYRACMNESAIEAEGLRRMKQVFEQMGGWPTLNGHNWREHQFDWKESVHKLRQIGINFEFFLILSLQRDRAEPGKYILTLKDPAYSPSEISKEVRTLYLNYMVDVAVLLGAARERAEKEQNDVMQFLLKMAKISEEARTASNASRLYNPLSMSELQYAFPGISWLEYINNLLSPAAEITHDDVVNVPDALYLRKVLSVLNNTTKRTVANFMAWHTVQHLIKYLPHKILNRAYEYLAKVGGKMTREPRWSMCVNAIESRMSPVISAAYLDKYFDEATRGRAVSMIRNIKRQFRENLYKLDWLDEKTKDLALEKLVSSVEDIASYNKLVGEDRIYDKVEIFEDKLLTSVLNLDYVNTNIQYGKLRQYGKDDFFQTPRSVTGLNIVYMPKENALKIPAGLFQGILFQKDRPDYMNYGAVGTIIANEIYHIIIEAEYPGDSQGEIRSWWSSHSLLNYEEKLQCLESKYGKFIISKIEEAVNKAEVQVEEPLDLAGIKIAYDSYVNGVQENGLEPRLPGINYSPNQLFWILTAIHQCSKYSEQTLQKFSANNHQPPAQFRVNGAVENIPEFAQDFGCAANAQMNPEKKCSVW